MSLQSTFDKIREASRKLALLDEGKINTILEDLAVATVANLSHIIRENQKDLDKMDSADPKYDRLKLTPDRLEAIAADIRQVKQLSSPIGLVLEEKKLENGLNLKKISVPIGVLGIIYESRPNVTFDVFSLSLKSGNAVVLKGSSDAHISNLAIIKIIHEVLEKNQVDKNVVALLPADRDATKEMLQAVGYIDLIIPRGSQGLINFVRDNSKVPVIETGAGIVHTYYDASADLQKGASIITNAKTRRVSVCNALDCLIIHQEKLNELKEIGEKLADKRVMIFADPLSYEVLRDSYPAELLEPAKEEHFGTEFLSMTMSIKTVRDIQEALDHIARYSSRHSEAIIAEDEASIDLFFNAVDAAAVYANTSTAFTDGSQFGMGAEIGISTQKLHARGPMALKELTSYKWTVRGNGQIRN
jgi:glutamate-5-semialdehyde dehydrogenase